MTTIVLCNMKGGTAKTTTSVALANGLHDQGKRVLLADMDPQMNAAFMSGVNIMEAPATLFDVFRGKANIEGAIQATAARMGTTVFDSRIRRAQALQDATATQEDIYTAAARSTATEDYRRFVTEVLERIEGKD